MREKTATEGHIPDVVSVNKGFAITVISLFISFLALPTLIWGMLRLFAPATAEGLNFDTGEQRTMASFPDKFNPNTFTVQVENWYNDHLPFRSVLYKTQERMLGTLERPYTETIRPALIALFHGNEQASPGGADTDELPPILETETEPPVSTEHNFVSNVTTLPLCGQKYEETLTCSDCGYSETRIVEKPHTYGKKLKTVKPSYADYGYTLIQCADCECNYRTEIKNKLYYKNYMPPIYHKDPVFEGRDRWLYYAGDPGDPSGRVLDYYQGTNLPTQTELDRYLDVLTQLKALCDEREIQLLIAVWPNKEEAYSEYMPSFEVADSYKRVDRWIDYVTENSDVKAIYPTEELAAAKPYCETYFPYDTHWNNFGGFVGYQAMLKALSLETTSFLNLPIRELRESAPDYRDFVPQNNYDADLIYGPKKGTCYLGGINANQYDTANYIVNYRPEVHVLNQKGSNDPSDIRQTTSDGPNDLNFVMLADSFRVMQLTYLERDFTDCFLCHRNQVKNSKTAKAIKKADILVIAAVERYEQDIIRTAQEIIQILSEK